MAFAISSTWSSFFWEPIADQAVWFAWLVTALLLLVPTSKSNLIKQFVCYFPSLIPLVAFVLTQPLFEGWSLVYTATLTCSLCLYLGGHIAFHWKALIAPSPPPFLPSNRFLKFGLSVLGASRVIAAAVWLTLYGSVFYLEMKTGFLNSSTPMIWLMNVVFVSLVFGFSMQLLCPRVKQTFSLGLMEAVSAGFACTFLLAYFFAAAEISSGTAQAPLLSQSVAFAYLNLSPAFFSIALLLLAIARTPTISTLRAPATFRLVNEPR